MHRSWPALEVLDYRGWLLRSAGGVTKRANSVLALSDFSVVQRTGEATSQPSLRSAVEFAETHYRELAQPCIFQRRLRTEPDGLAALLRQRGYTDQADTEIMIRQISVPAGDGGDFEIEYAQAPTAEWLDFMLDGDHPTQHRRTTFAELFSAGAAVYASLREQGQIRSIGRLSLDPESGWAGLAALATEPVQRGRGMGTALINGLLAFGYRQGARRVFLQVECTNPAARRLYSRLGFEHAGEYFYSIASPPIAG